MEKTRKKLTSQEIYDMFHGSAEDLEQLNDYLVWKYGRFIHKLVNDYFGTFCPKYEQDLYHSGVVGMLCALQKYLPKCEFDTYAKGFILHEMSKQANSITQSGSAHYGTKQKKVIRAQNQLRAQGVEPTISQVAIMTNLSVGEVKEIMDVLYRTNFVYMDDTEKSTVGSRLSDSLNVDPEKIAEYNERIGALYDAIDSLPELQKDVIIRHYGLYDDGQSLSVIARELDQPVSSIRTSFHNALVALNKSEDLRGFFKDKTEDVKRDINEYNLLRPNRREEIDKQMDHIMEMTS